MTFNSIQTCAILSCVKFHNKQLIKFERNETLCDNLLFSISTFYLFSQFLFSAYLFKVPLILNLSHITLTPCLLCTSACEIILGIAFLISLFLECSANYYADIYFSNPDRFILNRSSFLF